MDPIFPTAEIISDAHDRIREWVHKTPVITSTTIDEICNATIYFKCENLQKIGAFKIRGAINTVMQLTQKEKQRGIATHSSGNHAQGVALAAKLFELHAHVVMPSNSPLSKINAVKNYGAEITFCEPTPNARQEVLGEIIEKSGATMIHPYDDYRIIAGQATVAKELIEEIGGLDVILCPIGGGGLASGTVLSANYFGKGIEVVGAEPEGAQDAYLSLAEGDIVPVDHPSSIADGLLSTICPTTYQIIANNIKAIITVSESEIISAMKFIWERMKVVVEPSAAVPFAALLKSKTIFENKKIGIILTGGNVDLGSLPF